MAIPTLAPNYTWFAPSDTSITRSSITEINIVDRYTPTGNETASWDASEAKDGGVMCYVNGTVLTIAGNGSGGIYANRDASSMFAITSGSDRFSNLLAINGADKLDTSNATTFRTMFRIRCSGFRLITAQPLLILHGKEAAINMSFAKLRPEGIPTLMDTST